MNTTQETEFDYQAYMRESTRGPSEINRGTKAREKRREAAKARISQNGQLNRVLKKIQEIAEKSADGDYIYRGEPEHYEKVSSSLYRKYSDIDSEHFDIEIIQKEILEAAKRYTSETDDFEILTELQHYGGATNLIDFTTDYLIALFFACEGSDFLYKDSRVILLRKTTEINGQIESPQNPKNRVIAQKSIFVRPSYGFIEPDHVINIPKDLKSPILDHLLKYHGISTETIYNDLHGFIRYQSVHQSASAEFYAGFTYQNEQNCLKAIEHYSKAIELNPRLAGVYNNRGTAYSSKGEFDRAIADYDKEIELNPECAEAYNNRGADYHSKGEFDRAIKNYDKAIELNPECARFYYNRGIIYSGKGELGRAIADYDKAIELNPEYVKAYYNRGVAYSRKGEFDHAIKNYNKVIELNPKNADAYNNRGTAYSSKGEFDRAIADYDKTIELNPKNADAYNNRGTAYSSKGEFDRAIADYDKTIELNPKNAEVYNNRGTAYINKGELDRVIADYDKTIELIPKNAEVYNNRGTAYINKGEFDRAIADYDKAIELNPKNAGAYNNRGVAYSNKGELGRAIADYDKAIELNPKNAGAYNNRGMSWLSLQNWQKAKSDLTFAKSIGMDIIVVFRNIYGTVDEFEKKNGIELPKDIAAMLKP